MVTVPTNGLRTVAPKPISGVYQSDNGVNADTFGAGAVRALGEGAKLIDKGVQVVEAIRQDEAERDAKERDVEYAKGLQEIMFGNTETGEQGWTSLQGKAALDAVPATQERVRQLQSRVFEGASNLTRRMMQDQINQRTLTHNNQLGRAMVKAAGDHRKVLRDARKGIAITDAANDANNPDAFDNSAKVIRGEAVAAAAEQGYGPTSPVAKAAARAEMTVLANTVIENAINTQNFDVAARVLTDTHETTGKYKIDPSVRATLLKKLFEASNATEAQRVSDEAFQLFPNDPLQAREYIKANLSGEPRNAAMTALNGEYAAVNSVEAQARAKVTHALALDSASRAQHNFEEKKAKDAAFTKALEKIRDPEGKIKSSLDLPLSLQGKLSPSELRVIDDQIATLRSGKAHNTSEKGYENFEGLMKSKAARAAASVAFLRKNFGDREFNYLVRLKQNDYDNASNNQAGTLATQISARLDALGMTGADQKKLRGEAYTMILQAVSRAGGTKNLTFEQTQKVIQDVTRTVEWKRKYWMDGTKTLPEIYTKATPAAKEKARQALLKANPGATPTNRDIAGS